MHRKLVNHHKFKKKWGKRLKNSLRPRSSHLESTATHSRDFSWQEEGENPYRLHREGPPRRGLQIGFLIICLMASVACVLFHPFFWIKEIDMTGLQRISQQDLRAAVEGELNVKKLFFLPGQSYVLVSVRQIHDMLAADFPVASVVVKKEFPNTLTVVVEEKISTVIYHNGEKYAYLGLDGKAVEFLPLTATPPAPAPAPITPPDTALAMGEDAASSTIPILSPTPPAVPAISIPLDLIVTQFGHYPIVYDTRRVEMAEGAELLREDTVKNIIDWFYLIEKRTDIPFGYLVLQNEVGDAEIKTREGWSIDVKLDGTADEQFGRLDTLLREKIDRSAVNYVDLRYGSKVFWQ